MPINTNSSVLLLALNRDISEQSNDNFKQEEQQLIASLETVQKSNAARRALYENVVGTSWFVTNHSQFLLSFYGHLSIISLIVSAVAISFRITSNRLGQNNLEYAQSIEDFRLAIVKHYLQYQPRASGESGEALMNLLLKPTLEARNLTEFRVRYVQLRPHLSDEICSKIDTILAAKNPVFEPGVDEKTIRQKLSAEIGLIIGNSAMFGASATITTMSILASKGIISAAVAVPVVGAMVALISLSIVTIAAISLGQQARVLRQQRKKRQELLSLLKEEDELQQLRTQLAMAEGTQNKHNIDSLKKRIAGLEQKRLLAGITSTEQINVQIKELDKEIVKRALLIGLISLFISAAATTFALTLFATITGVAIGTIAASPILIPAVVTTVLAGILLTLLVLKLVKSHREYRVASSSAQGAHRQIEIKIKELRQKIAKITNPAKKNEYSIRLHEYELTAANEKMLEHKAIRNYALQATAVYVVLSVAIGIAIGLSTFGIAAIAVPVICLALAGAAFAYKQYKINKLSKEISFVNGKLAVLKPTVSSDVSSASTGRLVIRTLSSDSKKPKVSLQTSNEDNYGSRAPIVSQKNSK